MRRGASPPAVANEPLRTKHARIAHAEAAASPHRVAVPCPTANLLWRVLSTEPLGATGYMAPIILKRDGGMSPVRGEVSQFRHPRPVGRSLGYRSCRSRS